VSHLQPDDVLDRGLRQLRLTDREAQSRLDATRREAELFAAT
jgi:hypothetical protein